jgi:hypothetical protein
MTKIIPKDEPDTTGEIKADDPPEKIAPEAKPETRLALVALAQTCTIKPYRDYGFVRRDYN